MKTKTLAEQRADLKAELRTMIDAAKAANRGLSEQESARVDEIDTELKAIGERQKAIDSANGDLDDLAAPVGDYDRPDDAGDGYGRSTKARGSRWSKAVERRLKATTSRLGTKALLTGQIDVPPAVEIVDLPSVPTRLLDLVAAEELLGNNFEFLRQTVKTQNADVVADNATKPTSVYTFEEVEDRARVIAHLSEPFPLRYLADYEELGEILDGQMRTGVISKLEQQIVAGTGAGEQFRGILNQTGTTPVAFATDILTTIRKARTALENKGERPNAWVLNPADVEALELTRENGATGGFLLEAPAVDMLFGPGIFRVPSTAVPAGTAILADWSQIKVKVRQDAHTLAATQGDGLFDKNQVKLRSEGRYGVQIRRPQAFAVVDLTAA